MNSSSFLQNLNNEQRDAVAHKNGVALVLAGPGSGKTRVLTNRVGYIIENLSVDARSILSITFTNKAAKEMKERVNTLLSGVSPNWMGTFHSVCAKILRIDGRHIGIAANFNILDTDDSISIIKAIIKENKLEEKKLIPAAILGSIESAKNELIESSEYSDYARGFYYSRVATIYKLYEDRLTKTNCLDFGDLISKTVKLFSNSTEIKEKYEKIFQHILIDEFQDTNKAQYEFCRLLAEKHKNLFVVGDAAQSIYSFRGADYKNIVNLKRDFPDLIEYRLTSNYRSSDNIVRAAKTLIQNNRTNINLDLQSKNETGEKIKIFEAQNEEDEATFIVNTVVNNEIDKASTAILYRTNAQSRSIEEALLKYKINYQIFGGIKFYSRREIKDVISFIKVCVNPQDEISWKRIINIPKSGIGDKTFENIKNAQFNLDLIQDKTGIEYKKLVDLATKLSPIDFLEILLEKTKYLKYLKDQNELSEQIQSRIENVEELRSVAQNYSEIQDFLEAVSLSQSDELIGNKEGGKEKTDKITLMTLHSAKGLEFETVFITGLEEGVFPHSRSLLETEQLEEERRLCYVGITRAKKKLYLSYAKKRMLYGNTNVSIPSRFINEIPEGILERLNTGPKADSSFTSVEEFFSEMGI